MAKTGDLVDLARILNLPQFPIFKPKLYPNKVELPLPQNIAGRFLFATNVLDADKLSNEDV
ncbi:hypothetical protein RintRC_5352 [Richelia intracellularis]|nr:hypothetical protein RintRC_5352 [Richelia intracellularis]